MVINPIINIECGGGGGGCPPPPGSSPIVSSILGRGIVKRLVVRLTHEKTDYKTLLVLFKLS